MYIRPEIIVFRSDDIQKIIEANASSGCKCYSACYFNCPNTFTPR